MADWNKMNARAQRQIDWVKEKAEAYLWLTNRPEDAGKSFVIRQLSSPYEFYPFSYPSIYESKDGEEQDGMGTIHLAGNPYFTRSYKPESPIEDAMIRLWWMAESKVREYLIKNGDSKNEDIKKMAEGKQKARLDGWRFQNEAQGFIWLYNGKVVLKHMERISYDPVADAQASSFWKQEFPYGVKHLIENDLKLLVETLEVKRGRLYYTPFISQLVATVKIAEHKTKHGKPWVISKFTPLVPEGFENLLTDAFADCEWCHPGDVDKLTAFIDERCDRIATGQDLNGIKVPEYRKWPDMASGELVYVATGFKSTEINPIRINVYEGKLAEYFQPEVVETIASQPKSTWFKPSTRLSLLGGFYYVNLNDEWIEMTQSEVKVKHTGNFVEESPEIDVEGVKFLVKYNEGALNRRPFNPWRIDRSSQTKALSYGSREIADWIAKQAQEFGIPLKGEVSIPTDPFSFLDQKAKVSTQPKTADLL